MNEDIRDIGRRVIDQIKKTTPADAGDLTISIINAIYSVRYSLGESNHNKIDHLEALFRQLVYGERYELPELSDIENDYIYASGTCVGSSSFTFNFNPNIQCSGMLFSYFPATSGLSLVPIWT